MKRYFPFRRKSAVQLVNRKQSGHVLDGSDVDAEHRLAVESPLHNRTRRPRDVERKTEVKCSSADGGNLKTRRRIAAERITIERDSTSQTTIRSRPGRCTAVLHQARTAPQTEAGSASQWRHVVFTNKWWHVLYTCSKCNASRSSDAKTTWPCTGSTALAICQIFRSSIHTSSHRYKLWLRFARISVLCWIYAEMRTVRWSIYIYIRMYMYLQRDSTVARLLFGAVFNSIFAQLETVKTERECVARCARRSTRVWARCCLPPHSTSPRSSAVSWFDKISSRSISHFPQISNYSARILGYCFWKYEKDSITGWWRQYFMSYESSTTTRFVPEVPTRKIQNYRNFRENRNYYEIFWNL